MFSMNPFMWSPEQGIEADVEKRFTGGPVELRLFAHVAARQ